jgi:hypothetical protein
MNLLFFLLAPLEDKKNLLNNDNNWQSFNLSKEKAKRILE